MPLSIDQPDEAPRERDDLPQICPICRQVNTSTVCEGCGLDFVTGDLARVPEAPPWRPDVEQARQRRRSLRRSPLDLIQAVLGESLRGWLGTLVAMLFLVPLWGLHAPLLIAFVCAYLLAERSRAALGSAVVLADLAGVEDDEDARLPLRPRELVAPLGQALAITLGLSPVLIAVLTSDRLAALQSAGFLTLASGVRVAWALGLATTFVGAAAVTLAIWLRPGRSAPNPALGTKPFELLELLGCFPKSCLLVFPLLALAYYPVSLVLWLPLLLLVVGALASGWGDLTPPALWQALKTTPRYEVFVGLGAPPLVVLTLCLTQPSLGIELAVPGLAISASALGILAGIARQDCEANQRPDEEADDAGDEPERARDELPYVPRV